MSKKICLTGLAAITLLNLALLVLNISTDAHPAALVASSFGVGVGVMGMAVVIIVDIIIRRLEK